MEPRVSCRISARARTMIFTATVLVAGGLAGDATAGAAEFPVGHSERRIVVLGAAAQELRQVDVQLWYPAEAASAAALPKAVYSSALHGLDLVPGRFDPLSWTVDAELAREDAAIDPVGKPFPVIVFSHGNTNDPIDYAHTLERIASAGFVVAAPSHVNNTQDDTRLDFINAQAGTRVVECNDGRAGPCSRTNVPFSMADRVSDISSVLSALDGWFGTRVDTARAGVFGHSRGTVSALAAAGGSASPVPVAMCEPNKDTCWPLKRDERIQAVMGMAIGALPITLGVDFKKITVPTLLVAGDQDQTSTPAVSRHAYDEITSSDKRFVLVPNATHRTFDSTYCAQMRAAGTIAQGNPRAILDRHTFDRIVTSPTSGWGTDYCSFASFAGIEALTLTATGISVTASNVPGKGTDTDAVKEQMTALAVDFFSTKLARAAGGGVGGTVPATLSLTLGAPASFGAFTPGVDRGYDASTTATVLSTAGDATLSVTDPSANATGRLVNGAFALSEPLQARANSAAFASLSTTASAPLALRSYALPVSNDVVTIGFRQHIAATQALRTGTYAKTLTFTLSTTMP